MDIRLLLTDAKALPTAPTVTPPEKNKHGTQDCMYRKSGLEYLK